MKAGEAISVKTPSGWIAWPADDPALSEAKARSALIVARANAFLERAAKGKPTKKGGRGC